MPGDFRILLSQEKWRGMRSSLTLQTSGFASRKFGKWLKEEIVPNRLENLSLLMNYTSEKFNKFYLEPFTFLILPDSKFELDFWYKFSIISTSLDQKIFEAHNWNLEGENSIFGQTHTLQLSL